jgi:hypothetical protein
MTSQPVGERVGFGISSRRRIGLPHDRLSKLAAAAGALGKIGQLVVVLFVASGLAQDRAAVAGDRVREGKD